jgi:hypothetical protein
MIRARTVALAFPLVSLALLTGCTSASSTVGNTAATATATPAHSSAAPSSPAAPAASGSPAGATQPPAGAVYFAQGGQLNGPVLYEPACRSGCELSGDSTTALWNMSWSSWNRTDAVGAGTEKLDDCDPNCAAGTVHAVKVVVTFSKPVTASCDGTTRQYWTQAAFSWPDGLPSAFSGQNAPENPFSYPGIGGSGGCG